MTYWRSIPIFEQMADELAEGRVVFLTGAGISYSLPGEASRSLPSWLTLLEGLRRDAAAAGALKPEDGDDLDVLLATDRADPTSAHFLEAASILDKAVGPGFQDSVARATTSMRGKTTDTHKAIQALDPRAIITFNYDTGHEVAAHERSGTSAGWETILASDPDVERSERQIRESLSPQGLHRKLMKAHGSVSQPKSLVLTRESYRELLVRRPAYRAFLTQIFMNYSVIAVGFGMDDPDFQDSLDILSRDIGGRVRRHMFVTGPPTQPKDNTPLEAAKFAMRCADQERRDVLMRRRYGFEALHCRDWTDIVPILEDLGTHAGPELRAVVEDVIDPDIDVRSRAHERLGRLSESGARRAVALIAPRLRAETDDWRASEWCFALGRILPQTPEAKQLLKEQIERPVGLRSAALAVIAFVEYAKETDLPWLRERESRWKASPHRDEGSSVDPDRRVRTYFEYAVRKTAAKFETWSAASPAATPPAP